MMPSDIPQQHALTLVTHQRILDLINTGIWSGIPKDRLNRWLRQFQNPDDRLFASLLLSQLIFRTEQQTLALVRQAFERILPPLISSNVGVDPNEILQELSNSSSNLKIRLVPVRGRNDQPGKSADHIARILRRQMGIANKYFLNPKDASDSYGRDAEIVFIFFDDFLGTGHQFEEFVRDEALMRLLNLANCIYLPLIAHKNGIAALTSKFTKLKVNAPETLGVDAAAFKNPHILANLGDAVSEAECRQRYMAMLERCGIDCDEPEGHGNLALLLAFSHAIPDNTLPIFWIASDTWSPLIDR